MIDREEVNHALEKMILSASGWRGVFSVDGEEGVTGEISPPLRIIAGAAALVFAEYLRNPLKTGNPIILLGSDTRPTSKAIVDSMIPVLLASGGEARYAGIMAAPEIMAWARNFASGVPGAAVGFIYISASHNPIGYNGIKFGLVDGGVLDPEAAKKLIAAFRSFLKDDSGVARTETLISSVPAHMIKNAYSGVESFKSEALKAYFNFSGVVAWDGKNEIASAFKDGLKKRPLGVVCDFNGSARSVSIDRDFFASLGLKFMCINGKPGEIVHRIVPEGESLKPCGDLLDKANAADGSFVLGYTPDCDGDRGNLVIWDDLIHGARVLEAQEVFALACAAEFAQLVWTGSDISKAALAVNDPTSSRVDRIAEAFGIKVFCAEVGEANVVGLARSLRENGYTIRILGEGSAGGNITHPSAVRDPVSTVLAIAKFLSVRSTNGRPGLFEIWCKSSGQKEKYSDNFTLADIIASLPRFASTPSYSDAAILSVKSEDHSLLKSRYQKVFSREWEEKKNELMTRYGFHKWEAIAYNGQSEKRALSDFALAGRGGLKIAFYNRDGVESAFIWMRGSATEPVFRVMADAEDINGQGAETERFLLDWQRRMVMEADKARE